MRKILISAIAILAFGFCQAQLPARTLAPNFTGTDLNGNEWTLYDILDEGKSVIIEVSAAWCGPCWDYHSEGIMEEFYNTYGPDGTNEAMVLFIEGESTNTEAQLHAGANTGDYETHSQGDWVTGTPFPIIDDASIAQLLEIGFFPTFMFICPDRVIQYADGYGVNTQTGDFVPGLPEWEEMLEDVECHLANTSVDPRFLQVNPQEADCADQNASLNIYMQNKGTEPLTAATITVTGAGTPIVHDWTGNLGVHEAAWVEVTGIEAPTGLTVNVSVTSTDDVPANSNEDADVISGILESSTHIRVVFSNDPWPDENNWKILDSDGNVVVNGPTFPANPTGQTTTTYNYWVPSVDCYTFAFTDEWGDGLNGSLYQGGWDGSIYAYSVDANGVQTELYVNDGSEPMGQFADVAVTESTNFNATTVVSTEEIDQSGATKFGVYPNPASGLVNLNYTLTRDSDVLIDVINSVGVRVMSERLGSQKHGTYNTALDLSSLAAGVYMMNLNADGVISTVRVVIK